MRGEGEYNEGPTASPESVVSVLCEPVSEFRKMYISYRNLIPLG
jgi:hypothetical protein